MIRAVQLNLANTVMLAVYCSDKRTAESISTPAEIWGFRTLAVILQVESAFRELLVELGTMTAKAAYSWLVKKGLEWTWQQLEGKISPKELAHQIRRAWAGSPELREACDPPPTFDTSRLSTERFRQILGMVLEDSPEKLGTFLFDEQLIDLPWTAERPPKPASEIGNCAARVMIDAALRAVASHDGLSNEFQAFAAVHFAAELDQIVVVLDEIRRQANQVVEALRRHDEDSAERHAEVMSGMEQLGQRIDADFGRLYENAIRKNTLLEQAVTKLLDEKAQSIWSHVQTELARWNYKAAHQYGADLQSWLCNEGRETTESIRGRTYLLLAHLELFDEEGRLRDEPGLERANRLYDLAATAFGSTPITEDAARLARFRAKRHALTGNHEAAIREIKEFDDDDSIATRLAIRIDADQIEQALHECPVDTFAAEWVEEALVIYSRSENRAQARQALDWAIENGDDELADRCRLAYAHSEISSTKKSEASPLFPSPLDVDDEQRLSLQSAIDTLFPATTRIQGRARVITGVEAEICAIAYACRRVLGKIADARELIGILRDWVPIHEAYARAALRGDVSCTAAMAERMRSEHLADFSLQLLAVDIELHAGVESSHLVKSLNQLSSDASNESDQNEVAHVAFQLYTSGVCEHETDATQLRNLCDVSPKLRQCLVALDQMSGGDLDGALLSLELVDGDDIIVRQLLGEIFARQEKWQEAFEQFQFAGMTLAEPKCLRKAAHFASRAGNRGAAIECLENAHRLSPSDDQITEDLAISCAAACDYATAAELFGQLAQSNDEESQFALNQARCLFLFGDPDGALSILEPLSGLDNAPLVVISANAQILRDIGRPREAWDLLSKHRDRGWTEPAYLVTCIQVAYSAGCDAGAEEALAQLNALRNTHKDAASLLHAGTAEEFVDWLGQRGKLLTDVADAIVAGRMPWLFAERVKNQALLWGWFVRTQPMEWVFEDVNSIADTTIYASNGYSVLDDENGEKRLLPIGSAPKGADVALDLTAAFTLDGLGLLERAISFFGHVYSVSSFLETVISDGARLRPHQPSRDAEQEAIREAVKKGRIRVDSGHLAEFQQISDFCEPADNCWTSEKLLRVLRQRSEMNGKDDDDAAVVEGPVRIELETLQGLHRQGDLDAVLSATDVYILSSDVDALDAAHSVRSARDEVRKKHEELWKRLKSTPGIYFETLPGESTGTEDEQETPRDRSLAFDTAMVAEKLSIPLLVDDRSIQAAVLNRQSQCPYAAFGTVQLLSAMHHSGDISDRELVNSLLQILRWRYRFVVLSRDNLRLIYDLAGREALIEVATYAHASMRDPGLFSLPEQSNPPIPVAFRYYSDWEMAVVGFVTSLWLDNSIPTETAEELTRSCLTECLPGVPRSLGALEARVAALLPLTILTQALFDLALMADRTRGHRALMCIAGQLGITGDEYLRIVGRVLNPEGE